MKTKEIINSLSNEFTKIVNREFTKEQLSEVIRRNKLPEYGDGICATHDFCDANMLMDEAFTTVMGREIVLQKDSDRDKWSKAWDISKTNEFKAI